MTNTYTYAGSRGGDSDGTLLVMLLMILAAIMLMMAAVGGASLLGPSVEPMPPLPPCLSPSGELCTAKSQIRDNHIVVKFETVDGREIGQVELLRVSYQDAPEFAEAGYGGGWIGQIQVSRSFQGSGWGRALFEYGNETIRLMFPGEARAVYDVAGWGDALMRDIPSEKILYHEGPVWVFVP